MGEAYNGERFLPEECGGEMAAEHYQRYLFAEKLVSGKTVLDAACGEGYGSALLARQAESVTGLDIDEAAVSHANQKYAGEKISFFAGSIDRLPFPDDSFDVVVSFETIEHVDEKMQEAFLKEIRRVLKKGGSVILSTPNKAVYTDRVKGVNKFHVKEFYSQEFIDFMRSRFEFVDVYCQYPEMGYYITPENKGIRGNKAGMTKEDTRYVILVCSDAEPGVPSGLEDLTFYDTSMYYFLYRYSHELEQTVLKMKQEAEAFQEQQENSIAEQKKYIAHLEKDLAFLKEQITMQREQADARIRQLSCEIACRDREIEKRDRQIEERDSEYNSRIGKYKEKIEKLNLEITDRDARIEKLELKLHPWKYFTAAGRKK